jgi:uncharacterized membrane protein YqjE
MSEIKPKVRPPGPLHRLAASFLGLMQSHLGVFSIELEEVREHLLKTLVLAIVGAGAILLCLLTLTLALVLMVDDAHRVYAVAGLAVFFVVLAAVCLVLARRGMSDGAHPFEMTIEELRRDRESLLP